jgi:two-component system, OmpR family, alkaline phosphatase synthesis response regulator PhoP
LANPKILVVEDDADFLKATVKVLESKPYDVITATNGKEGLQKAKEEKPDLVILDIMMPVTDGFEVAYQFGRNPALAKTQILALSSFADSSGQPFPFQVAEFLKKPVSPKDLLAKVADHLSRKTG